MNTELVNRPPVGPLESGGDGPYGGRLQVVVLLERPNPAPWSVRQVARLARRLGADLLVAAVFAHERGLDPLDRANLRTVREGVENVTSSLLQQGVRARGEVSLAAYGDQALVASGVADRLDADLVVVVARRGAWFGVFPGSPLAHKLMRKRRRPVLVVPDYERGRSWHEVLGGPARPDAPQGR